MKLQEQRKKAKLTQQQLATLSNVKLDHIQKYERGYRDIDKAQLKTIASLCVALNCSITDIVEDEELIELLERCWF